MPTHSASIVRSFSVVIAPMPSSEVADTDEAQQRARTGWRPFLPKSDPAHDAREHQQHESVDGARPGDDERYLAVIEVHRVILARR